MPFTRDASHWLFKWSPDEWIQLALGELRRAEKAYASRDVRGGLAACRRAAGMALNGALIVKPNERWGRSYVDHLRALGDQDDVPVAVQAAARLLLATEPPGPGLVTIGSARGHERVVEAAKDVIAHGFALVRKHGERRAD